jgi:hypothetical protein
MQDADPALVPFFGCGPHLPDRTRPEMDRVAKSKRRVARPCPTCGGEGQPDGSPFVCMGCHAVAPAHQSRFDSARIEAAATREPERNLMRRSAATMLEGTGGRTILTADERAELVREYPDLAPRWLDSLGQPAGATA